MAGARRADMAEATDLEPMPAEQPKMVVTHGRGGIGKSTGVRILKERADEAGRPVAIADADRTNATLGSFYADVVRPEYRGEQGVTDCWTIW
jgi:Mrp family chromosome partitioning ATPase